MRARRRSCCTLVWAPISSDVVERGEVGEYELSVEEVPLRAVIGGLHPTAPRISLATLAQASSGLSQLLTGLPSLGSACKRPKGLLVQSHARTIIGMTRASRASCLCKARFISMSKQ